MRVMFHTNPSHKAITQFVESWGVANAEALADVGARSLIDPPGTVYLIPPLSVVVFQTARAKKLYWPGIVARVKRKTRERPTAESLTRQHTTLLATWAQRQLARVMTGLAIHAVFIHEGPL